MKAMVAGGVLVEGNGISKRGRGTKRGSEDDMITIPSIHTYNCQSERRKLKGSVSSLGGKRTWGKRAEGVVTKRPLSNPASPGS